APRRSSHVEARSPMQAKRIEAFRASLFHFLADPLETGESAYEYFDDGLFVSCRRYRRGRRRGGTTVADIAARCRGICDRSSSIGRRVLRGGARRARMICGKCMMDRHCPDYLRDTAESSYEDLQALI